MAKVDLSKYLTFIRYQWGSGCFDYALMAVWDILNEIHCPNSPNMSMAFALHLFHRPDLWKGAPTVKFPGYYRTPDGRYQPMPPPKHPDKDPYAIDIMKKNWMQTFGNPSEGSQPSIVNMCYDAARLTEEAVNEAHNYRMKTTPTKIECSTAKFKEELNKKNPIYFPIGSHVVAIVGYDDSLNKFKYVDSRGDSFYDYVPKNAPFQGGAFGSFTYKEIDDKKTSNHLFGEGIVDESENPPLIFSVVAPRPVPTARIWVRHNSNRNNINLWLSVEDSQKPKKKIWPAWERTNEFVGWMENRLGNVSHVLNFTVRLPSEFIWPPSPSNRLVLDLYDSGAIDTDFSGGGGGELIAFGANFGAYGINSEEVLSDPTPILFKRNEHRRFYIP